MKRVRANTKPSAHDKSPAGNTARRRHRSSADSSAVAPSTVQVPDTAADIDLPARLPSAKALRFIELYVQGGMRDPLAAAKGAGFSKPSVARELLVKYRDLIAAEDFQLGMSRDMPEAEALGKVAGLARNATDDKVKLAALRTILEAQGVIGTKGAVPNRNEFAKMMETLVADIRQSKGGRKTMSGRTRVAIAIEHDDSASHIAHTPSSDATTGAITVSHTADRARKD